MGFGESEVSFFGEFCTYLQLIVLCAAAMQHDGLRVFSRKQQAFAHVLAAYEFVCGQDRILRRRVYAGCKPPQIRCFLGVSRELRAVLMF